MKLALALALLSSLFLVSSISLHAQGSDFTLIVMPDVQNESQFYPQVLAAQTQWIVNSRTSMNIQAVLGLGDIVNNGSDNTQWTNADAAYQLLDQAQLPYFLGIGNHDYDGALYANRSVVGFNQWFGPSRYANHSWYGGNYNGSNENFYGFVNLNGTSYLILVLEFIPRDEVVQWATALLQANTDKQVILVTHSYMYSDNTRVDQCDSQTLGNESLDSDNYGDKLWSKFVSQFPNIEMVLSGHVTNGNGSRRVDLGVAGNLVNQIFSNYQLLANGGDGYLRILTYHPGTNTVSVTTYSPYLNAYKTDAANQFTLNWHAPTITSTTGTISGLVRDSVSCKPVTGARITAGNQIAVTDAKGQYSITLPAGSYSVSGVANDYASGALTQTVNNGYASDTNFFLASQLSSSCKLSTTSPSVTICTPGNGSTLASPVPISAGSTDTNLVSNMQLYLDHVANGTQTGGAFNSTTPMSAGTHRVTVQAKDSVGTIFNQTVNITVSSSSGPCILNPTSPTVTICTPADGATLASSVTVTAGTTDSNPVSYIQLYVDGSAKVTQNGGTLNATVTLTAGSHRVTVQAKDSTGTIFKQTINVTVSGN